MSPPPSGADAGVLQAVCLQQEKEACGIRFFSLLKAALKYGVNSLQYLLFVAWLPPSPASSSLLNPFSLLSFYLY